MDFNEFDKALLQIDIQISDEPLVSLKKFFLDHDIEIDLVENTKSHHYLRAYVAERLGDASVLANKLGYTLRLFSAFRTIDQQRELFYSRFIEMKQLHPDKEKRELLYLTNAYTAGVPILAAHTAGAAVDVELFKSGESALDFGTSYGTATSQSNTLCEQISQSGRANRQILVNIMEKNGFTNYPFEWWHFSIGDACAAFITGCKHTIYDPVNFDFNTGELFHMKNKQLKSFF